MVTQHYRWDFIGLSTDEKPTPETSEKVVDGSTFYCSDNSKLYVFYKNTWYEKTVSGGGGGTSNFNDLSNRPKYNGTAMTGETDIPLSPSVVQTTGGSTTDVMSQAATTTMIFNGVNVQIGSQSTASSSSTVAIGQRAKANAQYAVALGSDSTASGAESISFPGGKANDKGVMEIGLNASSGWATYGYNNTPYRLISGVHDGQTAHDAATVAQGNTLATSAPTTSTVGVLGQLYTDTTNMHTYQCTAISGNTYTWTQRW